ncbi:MULTISPECIES: DEAD/DEAH box helicase [unclassified Shewanella]|uniref:DEAD/DEAH box helicase n=1 Tax=unclassified Shewanella TaxID=196818 RepID=UPI0006D65BA4|nr:DEAD/DEAH box helicase [Shewanella sp. P1-14-1]KPZ69867.1 ATP-dependent RNA helicase RhlE [Shewanella sp. P1-14-1]
MTFDSVGFSQPILDAVKACGYDKMTPVQQVVMPLVIEGKDVLASAQTGTGKTAAFSLPLLSLLSQQIEQQETKTAWQRLRVLIMTPTRELAIQIERNIVDYAQFLPFESVAVYGGASINPQRKALNKGVDILVATPGRLFDIIGQYDLDLSFVTHLVIDEADRMLDLGFVKDIEKVKRLVNRQHQTMMFSATYSEDVKSLAAKMLKSPEFVHVSNQATADTVSQSVFQVDKRRKAELLSELIGRNNWQQVMVFTSMKETAEHLLKELKLDGIKAAVFHGDKTQGARNRALEEFKSGKLRVMIATDLAARGLDIEALPLVINFELPPEPEDYVHRIGRTGRAGLAGQAISLVAQNEMELLSDIESLIQCQIEVHVQPGYEAGAPLPARYREVEAVKPKKSFKHKRPNGHRGNDKAKPSRQGKYAKKAK